MDHTPLEILLAELTVYRDCERVIEHVLTNYKELAAHCKVIRDGRGRLSATAPSYIACAIAMIVCGKVIVFLASISAISGSWSDTRGRSAGQQAFFGAEVEKSPFLGPRRQLCDDLCTATAHASCANFRQDFSAGGAG